MNAEKLSITLPTDMAQMIRRRVESGAYASNSEVIREALRLWQERERRLDEVRAKIQAAMDNPVRLTPEEVQRHFEELYAKAVKSRGDDAA